MGLRDFFESKVETQDRFFDRSWWNGNTNTVFVYTDSNKDVLDKKISIDEAKKILDKLPIKAEVTK